MTETDLSPIVSCTPFGIKMGLLDDLPVAYRAEPRKRGRSVGEANQEDRWGTVWCRGLVMNDE
jgi:hypothetical protein